MDNQPEKVRGSVETGGLSEKNGTELLINIREETSTEGEDSEKAQDGSVTKETRNVSKAAVLVNDSNELLHEISESSPSQNRPSMNSVTEEMLTRRKSLRTTYSKPKSRFGEKVDDADADAKRKSASRSPSVQRSASSSPSVPRTPLMMSPERAAFDEEEEETFRKVEYNKRRVRKKLRTKSLIKWLVFLGSLGCLVLSLTIVEPKEVRIWGFEFWRWAAFQMVLINGLFFSNWLMKIVVFIIERNFLLKKKLLYIVNGVKMSAVVLVWAVLVLISWAVLFHHSIKRSKTDNKVFDYVTKNLASLLVGILLWFLKSLWVRMLASNFHVNVFFDRIQESIFHQYVLQTLSGPPLMELAEMVGREPSMGKLSFRTTTARGNEPEGKKVIDVSKLRKMKVEKVSSWTTNSLIEVVRNSGLSILSGDIDDEDGDDGEIKSEPEAIAAAYHIFRNVAQPGSMYVDEDDLRRFLIIEEVDLVFPLFDGSDTGRISRQALTDWVVRTVMLLINKIQFQSRIYMNW